MWPGQAFLGLSQTQRGWQHLTVLLGLPRACPKPQVVAWHVTLASGVVTHSSIGKGARVLPTGWVTLVEPLAFAVPQFPNLSHETGLR